MKSVFYKKKFRRKINRSLIEVQIQHILAGVIDKRIPVLQSDVNILKRAGILIKDGVHELRFDKDQLKGLPLDILVQLYYTTQEIKKL